MTFSAAIQSRDRVRNQGRYLEVAFVFLKVEFRWHGFGKTRSKRC